MVAQDIGKEKAWRYVSIQEASQGESLEGFSSLEYLNQCILYISPPYSAPVTND